MLPDIHIAIIVFAFSAISISLSIFIYVAITEIRLDARVMIVKSLNQKGKIELDAIEKEFAVKLLSISINDRSVPEHDLDLIFIDYLADRHFLRNFAGYLKAEVGKHDGKFRLCRSKLLEVEGTVRKWAEGDLRARIPKKYFEKDVTRNWKVKMLFFTLPAFFHKRAINFLTELKQAIVMATPSESSKA